MAPSTKSVLNRRSISAYVGEDSNHFTRLVEEEQLPAYRTTKSGRWKARANDLDKWISKQAEKYLKH